MRNLIDWYLDLDRRWIYLVVFLAVAIPTVMYEYATPIGLPIQVREEVTPVFEKIERMPPGSNLLIANDYAPSAEPELYPMTKEVFKHAFRNDLDVYTVTLWPQGPGLVTRALEQARSELKQEGIRVEPGKDYVFFGYKPGVLAVILGMGESIIKNFPRSFRGRNVAELPVMEDVESLKDMDYGMIIAAGNTVNSWLIYGSERYDFDMGVGVTAVIAPEWYPFWRAGQVNGLLGGLRGAAEYSKLLNYGRTQQIVDAAQNAPDGAQRILHYNLDEAYEILELELRGLARVAEKNPQVGSEATERVRAYREGIVQRIENNNYEISYLRRAESQVQEALGEYSSQLKASRAIAGMDAQSIVHLAIVIGVVLANVAFFGQWYLNRREEG